MTYPPLKLNPAPDAGAPRGPILSHPGRFDRGEIGSNRIYLCPLGSGAGAVESGM